MPAAHDAPYTDYYFLLESTDMSNLDRFYQFVCDWDCWQMNNDEACGQLTALMESTIQIQHQNHTAPKQL